MANMEINPSAIKVVDLSYPLGVVMMPTYNRDIEFKIDGQFTYEVDETGYPPFGYYGRTVNTGPEGMLEHYATHTEATAHAFGSRVETLEAVLLGEAAAVVGDLDPSTRRQDRPQRRCRLGELLPGRGGRGDGPDRLVDPDRWHQL